MEKKAVDSPTQGSQQEAGTEQPDTDTDTVTKLVEVDAGRDLILFNKVLEDCLLDDIVKDLPVFAISIIGDQRTGKSFLLNYIIRCLRNQRKWNWMGKEDETLTGFGWKPGSEGTTSGIMILKKPFVVDSSTGKVAVVLFDTEGLQSSSSSREMLAKLSTITGLFSTLQIFNVMRNLKESDLANFELFVYVASKAGESSPVPEEGTPVPEKETPETLNLGIPAVHFVVRDFIERKSGFEEGQRHLESRLKGKAAGNRWASLCELTKGVPMKCFLMSYPGETVSEDETYKGQTKGMRSAFKDQLNTYISSLLSDDTIAEAISSNQTCKELATRIKDIVKNIHEKKINCPTLVEMHQRAMNELLVAAKVEEFKQITKIMTGKPKLDCLGKKASVKKEECTAEIKSFVEEETASFQGSEELRKEAARSLQEKIEHEVLGPFMAKYMKRRTGLVGAGLTLGIGTVACGIGAAAAVAVAQFAAIQVGTAAATGASLGAGSGVVTGSTGILASVTNKLRKAWAEKQKVIEVVKEEIVSDFSSKEGEKMDEKKSNENEREGTAQQ
ncbi:atlastin-1-like [Latimeria chalumnae]|uniref:GB1/RHD3-type G domain-containing protein n=1 Tax=Latimeria chalumnae TaxID=7897 RepID=M3XJS1_LATCH|nr:PREDICTED: atlastin-1-like [Latimeria chalumnae]XP_014351378.1 PREDICTED: atlastin-1-like [Latimeria chalumnae]XP_014351379.1 PREDICTED: atlastin-1-like [Latimeria chalumnae]|eukprot:XP_006008215.1 PREDICTED: atlastin-1-like [Latimeria chalumnae]